MNDFESELASLMSSELTKTNMPRLREAMSSFQMNDNRSGLRNYEGYPIWPLVHVKPRFWSSLESILQKRRSKTILGEKLPDIESLSRILWFSVGKQDALGRSSTPSAGGLSSLHLYLIVLPSEQNKSQDWLPDGTYYYQSEKHVLYQLTESESRYDWEEKVPSLKLIQGGKVLFILVAETPRVFSKYTFRAGRYLLLEAGHLMQNLCLSSTSVGFCTVPLGGVLESEVARSLYLPRTDVVLYAGICGDSLSVPLKR